MRYSPSLAACTLAVALLTGQAVVAEPIPTERLAQLYEECSATNPGATQQRRYCWCFASSTGEKVSHQLLMTLDGEIKSQQARGGAANQVARSHPEVWGIIQQCRMSAGLQRLP